MNEIQGLNEWKLCHTQNTIAHQVSYDCVNVDSIRMKTESTVAGFLSVECCSLCSGKAANEQLEGMKHRIQKLAEEKGVVVEMLLIV